MRQRGFSWLYNCMGNTIANIQNFVLLCGMQKFAEDCIIYLKELIFKVFKKYACTGTVLSFHVEINGTPLSEYQKWLVRLQKPNPAASCVISSYSKSLMAAVYPN
jgi:hypothetical protein